MQDDQCGLGRQILQKIMIGYRSIPFDTIQFDFVKPIADLLGVTDLGELHEQHEGLFKVGADSQTSFHKKFYDKYHQGWPEMENLYRLFLRESIAPMMGGDFLYQKFPTFRVHLRENLAVGAFHTDSEFGHPPGEINFIIPLTDSEGSASIWVESEPGKEDYESMILRVGRLIRFDGNRLRHGNLVNNRGKTRVSMDFRVLPAHLYREGSESMTLKTKIREGDYYHRFTKLE